MSKRDSTRKEGRLSSDRLKNLRGQDECQTSFVKSERESTSTYRELIRRSVIHIRLTLRSITNQPRHHVQS